MQKACRLRYNRVSSVKPEGEVYRIWKNRNRQSPLRGQNLLEWYEALISAALVLVLIFSFFFRIIQVDGELHGAYAGQRR